MKYLLILLVCVACLVVGALVPSPFDKGPGDVRLAPTTDGADALSFVAFGRQGHDSDRYDPAVTKSLDDLVGSQPVHFGILLGDIIFPHGVKSIDDPLWQEKFEQRNGGANLRGLPFYGLLGNHDSYGNVDSMIEYAKQRAGTGRFRMGGRYYSEDLGTVDGRVLARIVFLDTVGYQGTDDEPGNAQEQVAFMRDAFAKPGDPVWRIVAGHYPVVSQTQMGLTRHHTLDALRPVFKELAVDLYLCSDPWFQEVHRVEGEPLYVATNGPNNKIEQEVQPSDTDDLFVARQGGFAHIRLDAEELTVDMVGPDGQVDYTATRPSAR